MTRKELYDLAAHCRAYSQELARHDQTRVNLHHCHEFNQWLAKVKSYDLLAQPLATLVPARPVARWQVLVLAGVLGVILILALAGRVDRVLNMIIIYGYFFSMLIFYFVPERFYGTTVEMIEAKVLRVVDALDRLLQTAELGLTEAAYFRVKENLEAARRELRQQIDIAHRRF